MRFSNRSLIAISISVLLASPCAAQGREDNDPPERERRDVASDGFPDRLDLSSLDVFTREFRVPVSAFESYGPLSFAQDELELNVFVGSPLGLGLSTTYRYGAGSPTLSLGAGFQASLPSGLGGMVSLEMVVTPLSDFGKLIATSSVSRTAIGGVSIGASASYEVMGSPVAAGAEAVESLMNAVNSTSEIEIVERLMRGLSGGSIGVAGPILGAF